MRNKEVIEKMEDKIEYLPFPLNVRTRVGVYLGGTDNADTLLREILNNSEDELAAGHGDTIMLDTNMNGYLFVGDNGRGISIAMSEDRPDTVSAYLSISDLHTGSKFSSTKNARSGMNGLGSSAVNACSETYILMSRITDYNYNRSIPEVKKVWENAGPRSKKDLFYVVICERGIKVYEGAGKLSDLEKMIFQKSSKNGNYKPLPEGQSTMVLFRPDHEIFDSVKAAVPEASIQYFLLIQEKFFNRKLNVYVNGKPVKSTFRNYQFEVLRTIVPKDTSKNKQVSIYITFEYDPSLGPRESYGSVNGLEVNSGQNIQIGEACIKAALKNQYKMKHDYLLNGLHMCVIVLASDVVFSEQIKSNLRSISKVKATDFVDVVKDIEKIMRKNPEYFDLLVDKLDTLAASYKDLGAIERAQKIMDQSSGVQGYRSKMNLKGYSEATRKDRMNAELFIVEGNSAAGSLVLGRKDSTTHAILGLRGKILNCIDKSLEKVLESETIYNILSLIGLGLDVNNVVSGCKTREEAWETIQRKARFGKIIIATDSDVDGDHISNLILTVFSNHARFLIDFGMVYRVISPIFKGYSLSTGKITYYYPDDPYDLETGFPLDLDVKRSVADHTLARYKGLGALDPSEVTDSFFSPSRKLIQITPEDIERSIRLNSDINARKKLLFERNILSNPYGFKDL